MIYTMGGCSYPATAKNPISEEQMWEGFPPGKKVPHILLQKTGNLQYLKCTMNKTNLIIQ